MKTLVVVFVAVLSISVISASRNRHHGIKATRNNEASDPGSDIEWPSPESINDFTVPDVYTGGPGADGEGVTQDPGSGDETPPARHHGKNHHKSHKN